MIRPAVKIVATQRGATGAAGGAQLPATTVVDNFPTFEDITGQALKDSGISFIDEDSMASDSAVKVPSQQSTKAYVDTSLVPINAILNPASASAPASLDLHEDTDNGTNKITIIAPSAVASDKVLTLPDETGTLISNISSQLLTGWIPVADSWAYASADAPTFTITVPSGAASLYSVGMRIKLTQTTVKYFIITAVADTVLTVYGGTDYTLANAAISAISYSTQKAPLGFPLDITKWTVITQSTDGFSQATPTTDVWYNAKSLVVPIGIWNIEYISSVYGISAASKTAIRIVSTLSTANDSESDSGMSQVVGFTGAAGSLVSVGPVGSIRKTLVNSIKSTQYLNIKTTTTAADVSSIGIATAVGTTIRAVCAYL